MSDFDIRAAETLILIAQGIGVPYEVLIADPKKYMRTPRCDTCKAWSHDGFVHDEEFEGRCLELGSADAPVITDSHFGCVQWEEKP